MKTLNRKMPLFVAALILAVTLTAATGLPRPAYNECERNTSWSIWNQLDTRQRSDTVNGKTTSTQDSSSRSELNSSRGEELTSVQTSHTNADGTSHSHQESHYSDPEGKGCHNSDGIPWKGSSRGDDDVDSEGNHRRHGEDIIEKNGKCVKYVWDREWDRTGKLIKETKSETEVPCSKLNLQFSREGTVSAGGITVQWGPNTAKIYLESTGGGSYKGNYEGVFDAKVTGKCNGAYTYPVSLKVTAKEDEFEDLDFSVTVTISMSGALTCAGQGGPVGNAPVTFTRTFTLPAQDGATKTYSIPMGSYGQITDTFTLKTRGP